MPRTRSIKPAFFQNEALSKLPPLTRLLFQGLWCLADRDGRLEDRPLKIRALILPYEPDLDAGPMLEALAASGFIVRYEVDGERFIEVVNFGKHQHCHPREPSSGLPAPPGYSKQTTSTKAADSPRQGMENTRLGKAFKPFPSFPSYPSVPSGDSIERDKSLSLSSLPANSKNSEKAEEIQERERISRSRFSLKECQEYAESLSQIDKPGGFAKTIWRSGEEDSLIAAWLEQAAGEEQSHDRRSRLRRFRRNNTDN